VPETSPSLHAGELLRALTGIALEVQRARTVADVLAVAGAGLEALGFDVSVLLVDGGACEVRYLSPRAELQAVASSLEASLGGRLRFDAGWMQQSGVLVGARMVVPDLQAAAADWAQQAGAAALAEPLGRAVRARGMAVPLNIAGAVWGLVLFMRDALGEADVSALELFALQLGSALEVAQGFERLDRRQAELELVHRLAVAGPKADTRALTQRALETVCRTTQCNAGALHRLDADAGAYELVGDVYGYAGPLIEVYRRFQAVPGVLDEARAIALTVGDLAEDIEAAGFRHVALIPLDIEGKRIGMLTLARMADEPFVAAELYSAEVLGVQMASQLERARLYDEANRLYRDLKQSYDQLGRAQAEVVRHERLAALGELAAVMAHEVRNPLGVIFNSLTTLRRLVRLEGDAEMLIDIVGEEAERLNRIVGDLLDFVRPYEAAPRAVDVGAVLSSAVTSAGPALAQPAVQVVTEVAPGVSPFPADAHLLKQALVNLLLNAAQAMPRGGRVTVRARPEPRGAGAWLRIDVEDEGVGLPPGPAERLFQPFVTTKATGTGLGLAVVKRIVDAHLGEVSAAPNVGGAGTTFTLRLPPVAVSDAPAP
jgi:signal transduction histidine kinase